MSRIDVSNLVKDYGGTRVVDGVSFEVHPGEVFALLGPNGAGKSTTIEMVEGHRTRTSGSVRVLGLDPQRDGGQLRHRIGIVLQDSGVEDQLTVREAIELYGSPYSRRQATRALLEMVELTDVADTRIKTLSGGQRRRVDLALGVVGLPDVLFLDEPTTGFDASARRRAWDLIDSLRAQGTSILLTTHYMDEVERLADRVAVIVDGQLVAESTPAGLVSSFGASCISFALPASHSISDVPHRGAVWRDDRIVVVAHEPTVVMCDLAMWAVREGIELEDLSVSRPSLEDAYLALASVGAPA